MTSTAIVGCSGFSGQETLDRVLGHPDLELVALGSDSLQGQPVATLDPRLADGGPVPGFVTNDEALSSDADLVFLCLGHAESAELAPPADAVVVDLSGAHRLKSAAEYERWYGFEHRQPSGLGAWCYAIPELAPPTSRLIANPGCYATAALLALVPVAPIIDHRSIVVDAKSGISGAGRALTPGSHAAAVLETIVPYRIGRHQHAPEIAQVLGFPVCLVTHVLPVRRGLILTCYVEPTDGSIRERLEAAYASSRVVHVLPEGLVPDMLRVRGTDRAELGVFADRATGRAIIVCALDNLGKGAAGQAVQNANVALGYPEHTGLRLTGVQI